MRVIIHFQMIGFDSNSKAHASLLTNPIQSNIRFGSIRMDTNPGFVFLRFGIYLCYYSKFINLVKLSIAIAHRSCSIALRTHLQTNILKKKKILRLTSDSLYLLKMNINCKNERKPNVKYPEI